MTSNWYLMIMVVLVVVGIAIGFGAALGINALTDGAVFEFGKGIGALATVFGCCALGVVGMYLLGVHVDTQVRKRWPAPKARTYHQKSREVQKTKRKKKRAPVKQRQAARR